jgi:hypothetical protein
VAGFCGHGNECWGICLLAVRLLRITLPHGVMLNFPLSASCFAMAIRTGSAYAFPSVSCFQGSWVILVLVNYGMDIMHYQTL